MHCTACKKPIAADGRPVYQLHVMPLASTYRHGPVAGIAFVTSCAACNDPPLSTSHPYEWREKACGGCGRPIFRNHWHWPGEPACSDDCRRAIYNRRRREARTLKARPCPICRISFTPTRRDQLTCSTRCRVAMHRRRHATPATEGATP